MIEFDILIRERNGASVIVDVDYGGDNFTVDVLDDEPFDVWGPVFDRIVETVAAEVGESPEYVATDWRYVGLSRRQVRSPRIGDAVRITPGVER